MTRNKIIILALVFCFVWTFEANAQTKKRKPKPRRPSVVTPRQTILSPTLEPEVISRAEDELDNQSGAIDVANTVNPDLRKTPPADPVKIVAIPARRNNPAQEKEDRSLLDLERLSLAEGRAENFRKQLSEVIEREAVLRSKVDQLEYQMRPEVIQAEIATIGSLRPEDVRDSRRKILENEKVRTTDQLTKVTENRTRLEAAILNADALVDKLRARVEAEEDGENQKTSEKNFSKDSVEPDNLDN